MKFRNVWASLALTACLSLSLPAADIGLVEEIVAKVNGDIITRSEIERARRQMEAELKARGTKGPDLEKIVAEREKDALRERIDQLLLVQKGKELGINVEPTSASTWRNFKFKARSPTRKSSSSTSASRQVSRSKTSRAKSATAI